MRAYLTPRAAISPLTNRSRQAPRLHTGSRRLLTESVSAMAAAQGIQHSAASPGPPAKSRRIVATDTPCIVNMQRMLRGKTGLTSLAQGIVHWSPPPSALEAAVDAKSVSASSSYGADEGDPDLRAALQRKLAKVNHLEGVSVMVTAGANQAFTNLVLALCDAGDYAVLFAPYYFNHLMALQMSSVEPLIGPVVSETMMPDISWLKEQLSSDRQVKMVVVCNPCNPTGALAPQSLLEEMSALCAAHQCWLVVDNTYEDFIYERPPVGPGSHPTAPASGGHACVSGDHVVNLFSFSKAYGMMGWRVGYLAYDDNDGLGDELLKAQDTIAICPTRMSQRVALAALTQGGPEWVAEKVKSSVVANRAAVATAIANALGEEAILGAPCGAIYFMVKLPGRDGKEVDDLAAVEFLAEKHGVVVIPGGACGLAGSIRVAFGNLEPEACAQAAKKLQAGLTELLMKPPLAK